VQEENSDWVMQDRLARIAASYGLISRSESDGESVTVNDPGLLGSGQVRVLDMPHDLDLWLVNHMGFDLTDEDCREALVGEIEKIQPVLVVLDPLYLMLGGADENKSHEIRGVLQWLLQLRYEYKVALAIVHHFRKQPASGGVTVRAGQRLMGNATLHGWVESSLYMEVRENEDLDPRALSLRVEPEMRNMAPRSSLDIVLRMGDPGDLEFEATVAGVSAENDLLTFVNDAGGTCTLRQLADGLGIDRRTARKRATAVGLKVWKQSERGVLRVGINE
jgi:hypothetical protein